MRRVECAGGIVVSPFRQILVITNQVGKHTFPKGTCEEGEERIDTARREIREESGITRVEIIRHLGTIIRPGFTAANMDTPSVIKEIAMFHCTTEQVELQPIASDSVDARWVEPEQLEQTLSWPEELSFFLEIQGELGLQ